MYIIGGGPSLETQKEVILKGLIGKRVIGVNNAGFDFEPVVDILFFGDKDWYVYHREEIKVYKKLVITCCRNPNEYPRWVKVIRRMPFGISKDPGMICWNLNSGIAALNLAVLLGASKVYLLGFDMQLGPKGQSNYHPNGIHNPDYTLYEKWKTVVRDKVEGPLRNMGVEVWNANPGSAMESFPKCSLESALQ